MHWNRRDRTLRIWNNTHTTQSKIRPSLGCTGCEKATLDYALFGQRTRGTMSWRIQGVLFVRLPISRSYKSRARVPLTLIVLRRLVHLSKIIF